MSGTRPRRRRALIAVIAIVGVVVIAAGAGVFVIAGAIVTPRHDPPFDLRVLAVASGTVTMTATADTRRPGEYGLSWRAANGTRTGSGILGPVTAVGGDRVTRRLGPGGTAPVVGDHARLNTEVWTTNPLSAVGLSYSQITYPDPLGPMPAWLVPGTRSTWVIQVHGYNGNRTTGLRVLPTLHQLGYPVLDISYRNDLGAPASPDHRLHLGDTEWQDLQAAVAYATAHHATGVILYGWSMGGGIVENFLHRSGDTVPVRAVVLDAPALDWGAIVRFQAGRLALGGLHLPGFAATGAAAAVDSTLQWRTGISLARINMLAANRRTGGPTQPVLLFHGTADTVVPFATSAAFPRSWPRQMTWMPVADAGHTQSWNLDPGSYDQALTAFLGQVGD